MALASRLAFIVFLVTSCIFAIIIVTTPEGDKDSHAYMLEYLVLGAFPIGLALGITGLMQSYRRRASVVLPWIAVLLFVVPALLLVMLLWGPF